MKKVTTLFAVLFVAFLAVVAASPAFSGEPQKMHVFAAASTTNAMTEIGRMYEKKSNTSVLFSFASSSTLAKQINQGAPAQLYVSANPKWMDFLEKNGRIQPGTRQDLLGNRIVIIAPKGAGMHLTIEKGFNLSGILGEGKLAMGDPDHVPAGIYGKQALESLGEWRNVAPKVASAKDVRAALVLVERAEVPLGIVYATDAAISDKVEVVGVFPEKSHPPITYPVALVSGQISESAADFFVFLQGEESREIFKKYGFSMR